MKQNTPAKIVARPKTNRPDAVNKAAWKLTKYFEKLSSKAGLSLDEQDAVKHLFLTSAMAGKGRLRPPLPKVAPERWKDRDKDSKELSTDFTRRVWGTWLPENAHKSVGDVLDSPTLRNLDRELYQALNARIYHHPEETLGLKTLKELNDDNLATLMAIFGKDELARISDLLHTRKYQREPKGTKRTGARPRHT